jgi:hypothetical protein
VSANARPVVLSGEHRTRLGALGDALIPGGAGLPSASEAAVHSNWVDRVLEIRPDMADSLVATLSEQGEPRIVLERLRTADARAYGILTFVVSGAYFMNPRVRKLLGYPGRAPARHAAAPGEFEHYVEGEILEPVRKRGSIYRPTPDSSAST